MATTLYSLALSHPSLAAHRMLELKRIDHRVVNLMPGLHPVPLRLGGFPGPTVPALRIDGRRIQGSREISRALDELAPTPRLFPEATDRRREVEEAERWGEEVLQAVPRRIFRWLSANRLEARRWLAAEHVPLPGSTLLARPSLQARAFARAVGATDDAVRRDIAELPALLDRVSSLRDEGVIGGREPNAADFQIGSSVRALDLFADVAPLIADHPAVSYARELFADFPAGPPPLLPPEWLTPLRHQSTG